MKKLLLGLMLLASMSTFASSSEPIRITLKKNIQGLIEKGVDSGEIYSYTRSKLGVTVKYEYRIIDINDKLVCYSSLPMSDGDSFQSGLLGFPPRISYCVGTIDTSVY